MTERTQKLIFKSRVSETERIPKPGGGLKRSSSEPQWISTKRVAFDLGDVPVRTIGAGKEPARALGAQASGSSHVSPEAVADSLKNLSTNDGPAH